MPRGPIALELVVFLGIVVADAYGLVPLTQTIVLVPLIWLALRLQRQGWSTIGFAPPPSWPKALAIGIAAGIAMELFAVFVTTPWISGAFGVEPDHSGLRSVVGSIPMLLLFLSLSWTLAAFGEELCFRGFLMQRLAALGGGTDLAWGISLAVSSVLFGWGHTEQGLAGWVQEGLSGVLLGALFLATSRNLSVPIVAHGVANTLAFVLIYLGRYPGLGL
jgi:hypothetical protein